MSDETLRVALVAHDAAPGDEIDELARALAGAGHRPLVLATGPGGPGWVRVPSLPESLLGRRGFTGPLTHVPGVLAALARGRPDVVHAFSAPDALAARAWRRRVGVPVAFTCREVLDRGSVSGTRLRLRLLAAAVDQSDALLARGPAEQAALARWLVADAAVLAPSDAAGHERLYRELLDPHRHPRA